MQFSSFVIPLRRSASTQTCSVSRNDPVRLVITFVAPSPRSFYRASWTWPASSAPRPRTCHDGEAATVSPATVAALRSVPDELRSIRKRKRARRPSLHRRRIFEPLPAKSAAQKQSATAAIGARHRIRHLRQQLEIGLTGSRSRLSAGVRWLSEAEGPNFIPRFAGQVYGGRRAAGRGHRVAATDLNMPSDLVCDSGLLLPGSRPEPATARRAQCLREGGEQRAIRSRGFDAPVFGRCRVLDRGRRIHQARDARREEATH